MNGRRIRVAILRAVRALRGLLPDAHVYTGIAFVAYGLGQAPSPWGGLLAPTVVGLGLLWVVRFGSEPLTRNGRR